MARVVVLSLLLLSTCLQASWQEALTASNNGAWAESAPLYQDYITQKGPTANAHYNLAYAYHRADEPGLAVLHYERALLIDPDHMEAQANLTRLCEDYGLSTPQRSTLAHFGQSLPWPVWLWLGLASATIAVWLGFGLVPGLRHFQRRWGTGLATVVLLVCVAGHLGWAETTRLAVVLPHNAPLRAAPTLSAPVETTLKAGTTASILGHRAELVRIRMADGQTGWTPRDDLSPLWP